MSADDDEQILPRLITLKEISQVMLMMTTSEEGSSTSATTDTFDRTLIDAIAKGFQKFSAGGFNVCPIQTMGAPPMARMMTRTTTTSSNDEDDDEINNNNQYSAQVCVKSGYMTDDTHFVIKVASGGYPWPSNSGHLQVYSQATGRLECLLLDDGILTELRTAAAGAVAVQYLYYYYYPNNNNKSSSSTTTTTTTKIGVVGTGIQARYQLRFMKQVCHDCKSVVLYGRTPSKVQQLKDELEAEGFWESIQIVDEPNELITKAECNIIITTTTARQAILTAYPTTTTTTTTTTTKRPTLMICIGADSVGKQELDETTLVAKADLRVCDSMVQTQERGEFQHAIRKGLIHVDTDVVELGTVIAAANTSPPKQEQEEEEEEEEEPTTPSLILFDSSGVAFQDCVVAKMVYEAVLNAEKRNKEGEEHH